MAGDAPAVLEHFHRLRTEDLRSRFGTLLSPESLQRYVAGIRWDASEALGLFDPHHGLVAVAHVAQADHRTVELGLSVAPGLQRQGLGRVLLVASARHAGVRGFDQVTMQCLRDNPAIMRWVRDAGFRVSTQDQDAFVTFPALRPGTPEAWALTGLGNGTTGR